MALKLRNSLSNENRTHLIYLFASVIGFGITFFQTFFFAYFFDVEIFGQISLLLSVFSLSYTLNTLGLGSTILRYSHDRKIFSDRKDLLTHIFLIWVSGGLLLTLIMLVIGYKVINTDTLKLVFFPDYALTVTSGFFFSFIVIFQNLFVAERRPVSYAASLIGSRGLLFFGNLMVVFLVGRSLSWFSISLFIPSVVVFVISIFSLKIFPLCVIKTKTVKEIIKFSLPLSINTLGGLGFTNGFRVILSTLVSFKDLALFNIASQLSSVFYLCSSSVAMGLNPRVYNTLEETNGDPLSVRFYLRFLFKVGLLFIFMIGISSPIFLKFFKNGEYSTAIRLLPLLLLGKFVFLLYSYGYTLLTFYKKTKYLTYSLFCGVFVSITLSFVLKEVFGLFGIATALVLGYVAQLCLVTYFVNLESGRLSRQQASCKEPI